MQKQKKNESFIFQISQIWSTPFNSYANVKMGRSILTDSETSPQGKYAGVSLISTVARIIDFHSHAFYTEMFIKFKAKKNRLPYLWK